MEEAGYLSSMLNLGDDQFKWRLEGSASLQFTHDVYILSGNTQFTYPSDIQ